MSYPDHLTQVRQAAQDFSGLDFGASTDVRAPASKGKLVFTRTQDCSQDRCVILDERWTCPDFYSCHQRQTQ